LLVVRHFPADGEHLVFNTLSGDIHLLNTAAAGILDLLAVSPASLTAVCAALDSDDPDKVKEAVEHLDRLGLIHPLLP
jgi:PqqD family protein of HPr-rel-A system